MFRMLTKFEWILYDILELKRGSGKRKQTLLSILKDLSSYKEPVIRGIGKDDLHESLEIFTYISVDNNWRI